MVVIGNYILTFPVAHHQKIVEIGTPRIITVTVLRTDQLGFHFFNIEMHLTEADEMANTVDPDQTAPAGAV